MASVFLLYVSCVNLQSRNRLWSMAMLFVWRSWDYPIHLVVIKVVFHWHM